VSSVKLKLEISLQIAGKGKEFEISIINAQKIAEKPRISVQLVPEPTHKEEGKKQFLHMTTRNNNSEFPTKIQHVRAPLSNLTFFSSVSYQQ
jgi:hypothetical protein